MSSLEKLEALAKAATPGEWELHTPTVIGLEVPEFARAEDWIIAETFGHGDDHDAAYIAAANPQAILSLLAEHRQLIERVEVLEGLTNTLLANGPDEIIKCSETGREWTVLSEWRYRARKALAPITPPNGGE